MDYNTNNSENSQISHEQNSSHLGTVPTNSDHEYSKNINYYQKYIKLLEENEKRDNFRKLIEDQILSINLKIDQKKTVQRIKTLEDENNKLTQENQELTKKIHEYIHQQQIESKNQEFFIKSLEAQHNIKIAEYNKKIADLEDNDKLAYDEKIIKLKKKKEFFFNELVKYQQEIEPNYKKTIQNLSGKLDEYLPAYEKLTQEKIYYKKVIEPNYKNIIDTLNKDISQAKVNYNDLLLCKNDLLQFKNDAEDQNRILLINNLEKSNRELGATNEKLRKENLSYQSALGDPSHFHLSSEANNQLIIDINSLQNKIEKFITIKGSFVKINDGKIEGLYKEYNLDTQNLNDKSLMKSVLQRFVLEKILEFVTDYLEIKKDDDPNSTNNQEKYIMYHTNKLTDLLNKFYNSHFKQDNNSGIKSIPIKIRQQVYGMLSEFGFSEVYENNKNQYVHPFISSTMLKLNQLMVGYRYIKDDNRRKIAENMAEDLIKDIVRIFKFRFLIQEPNYEVHWYENNVKINAQFMKGQWDDNCLDDKVVDICYFPLIGMELSYDLSNAKVFMRAKVFPRYITPSPPPPPPRRKIKKKRESQQIYSPPLLPEAPHLGSYPDETDEGLTKNGILGFLKNRLKKNENQTASSTPQGKNLEISNDQIIDNSQDKDSLEGLNFDIIGNLQDV